jgi:hypothetical protein
MGGLGKINGAVLFNLNKQNFTSAIEIWMEE